MGKAHIYGILRWRDGTPAAHKKITFAAAGMKDCFTDSNGRFEIEMESGYVEKAFVNGRCVWEGYLTGRHLDLEVPPSSGFF